MKSVHLSLDEDRITCTSLTKRVALRRLILTGDLMTAVLNQTLPPSNHFLGLVAAWPATQQHYLAGIQARAKPLYRMSGGGHERR